MRILVIGRGYPTSEYRLNGIFEFDQARALANAGVDVCYAAIDLRSLRRVRKFGMEKKRVRGITVFAANIPVGKIPKQIRLKISEFSLAHIYKSIVREWGKPDLIHAHFITLGAAAVHVFKGGLDLPVVITEHSSRMNQESIDPFYEKLGQFAYPQADRVIAVSRYLGENLKSRFNAQVRIIPNLLDFEHFDWHRSNTNDSKEFIFLSVGRLNPEKRFDLMIGAFAMAFKGDCSVKLIIFGDGPDRESLEDKIRQEEVSRQVELRGFADRSVIAEAMKTADAFVSTFRRETFGLAIIEALAMGLPVLSTNSGGPADFMNESNGLLLESDSLDSVANGFKAIKTQIGEFEGEKIAREIRSRFSGEVVAHELIGIYSEILDGKSQGDRLLETGSAKV